MSKPGIARLQPGSNEPPARLEPGAPGETNPGSATLQRGSDEPPARLEPGAPGDGAPGWYSRGYLPHFDGRDVIQHVTMHLSDSLPARVLQQLESEISLLPDGQQSVERRQRLHAWIDAGHGRCPLRDPEAAAMMQGVLLHGDGSRYRLLAWVVMPNHVHVLFQPLPNWPLAKIVASWKSYSGRKLSSFGADASAGHVWHREYWDRYIRNERHFQDVVAYIHANPVFAGLCRAAGDWPWSSARAGMPGIVTLQRGSNEPQARLEPGAPGDDAPGDGALRISKDSDA